MTDITATEELILEGDGWAISPSIDALGEGMFRRVRPLLGVTAFGINVKVMDSGSSSKFHLHTEQQEVIFVHAGEVHVSFGDGTTQEVGIGGLIVVHPGEPHVIRATSKEPAVLLLMGGKDGVVEGDAQMVEVGE
jgi:quercetin dioxygenase-like cupin family protein